MKKTITNTELSGLTMELYLLLHAGVGVGDALALLEQEEQNEISKKRQLNALRMEMQKAVGEENFERAAELRDQIHSLEQN